MTGGPVVDRGQSALVLSGAMHRPHPSTFLPEDATDVYVLGVSLVTPSDRWVRRWREAAGDRTARVAVVTTADRDRDTGEDATVATVSEASDLTGLGIQVSNFVEAIPEDADVMVCLDSLTVLMQYVDLQSVYRFINLLTTRLEGVGARTIVFFDPDTADDQSVATIRSVFSLVIDGDDGSDGEQEGGEDGEAA
jgi:hypothetical protein